MKHKLAYFVIIASAILLIFNLYNYYANNNVKGFYFRIGSNAILIVAMIFSIRARNKKDRN